MLQNTFYQLLSQYSSNVSLHAELWLDIEEQYSGKGRHYHDLQHLENLYAQLNDVKEAIQNWNVILFTLFYHDLVYNTLKTDNEEQSAVMAEKRMAQLLIPAADIALCKEQILATKAHHTSANRDTNYFTDADLSVLGQDWETYEAYFKNIRKEYSLYPSFLYNRGRKKVLQHFLAMERIFKTDYFHQKLEAQAKQNLLKELKSL